MRDVGLREGRRDDEQQMCKLYICDENQFRDECLISPEFFQHTLVTEKTINSPVNRIDSVFKR